MSDDFKLPDEFRRRLIRVARDPEGARRDHAVARFTRAEEMVRMIADLDDDAAEAFHQHMLDGAEPRAREIVARFIDRIRAARAMRPS
jgi:hypothetical protein